MKRLSWFVVAVALYILNGVAAGADWPQYRYDANRSAASAEALPADMYLLWMRTLPAPRPAFPGQNQLCYDATYEPVVMGKTMFVPSMVTDSVTALDTQTGRQLWQVFAEGPVRLAPVAWRDRVFFVSDDGFLYCVDAVDGRLRWKFRGLPIDRPDRKLMGDGRLVSAIPARGGPVLARGIIYFAAGIWSDEGVFVHAIDATTGKLVWSNTAGDRIEKANPDHGVAGVTGISPQGHLAIVNDTLIVPCGSQLPALMDLKTGKLHTYTMGWGGKFQQPKGCVFVSGIGKYLMHGGDLYDMSELDKGPSLNDPDREFDKVRMIHVGGLTRLQVDRTNVKKQSLGNFRQPALTAEAMYYQQDGVVAFDLTKPDLRKNLTGVDKADDDGADDRDGGKKKQQGKRFLDSESVVFPELWKLGCESKVHIKAGDRLYCAGPGAVEAVDIPAEGKSPELSWRAEVQGTPHRMLAADGKLFVVTLEGRIYAFGPDRPPRPLMHTIPVAPESSPDAWTAKAAEILSATGIVDGYILIVDLDKARLAEELVRQSACDVIAFQTDAVKAVELRQQFQTLGLYGSRVSVLVGDPASCHLPPYLAHLIVAASPNATAKARDSEYVQSLFRCLRPYGGALCLQVSDAARESLADFISEGQLPGGTLDREGGLTILTRQGPLAGTADWSHANANAANTGASQDLAVKPPLTRLWFDGTYRWHKSRGMTDVRVAGGRIFVRADRLYALDAYTGRDLWQKDTQSRGEKLIALEDTVYLAGGGVCAALDPATGEPLSEIDFPGGGKGHWSSMRVSGNTLVANSGEHLVCVDRKTGRPLWRHQSENAIQSIALGGGKVFCTDAINRRRRAVRSDDPGGATMAFDARSGELLWKIDATGEVQYSSTHELLVIGAEMSKDAVKDSLFNSVYPPKKFAAYRATDGKLLWSGIEATHVYIVGDELIAYLTHDFPKQALVTVHDLLTAKQLGREVEWWQRGCTVLRAGSNLLTTRYQGNAAYYNLATGQMTPISNVRAACSNNLFPANGVLISPNLSDGCACNYVPISQGFVPASALE